MFHTKHDVITIHCKDFPEPLHDKFVHDLRMECILYEDSTKANIATICLMKDNIIRVEIAPREDNVMGYIYEK